MKKQKIIVGALASVIAASSLCSMGAVNVNASTFGTSNKAASSWGSWGSGSSWGSWGSGSFWGGNTDWSKWKDEFDKWNNSTVKQSVEAKISSYRVGAGSRSLDITWKKVENATGYKIQVSSDMLFKNIVEEENVEGYVSGYSPIYYAEGTDSASNKKTYDKAIITGDMYVRVKPVFDGKEGTWCSTIYTKGYEDTTSPFGTKKHDPLKLKIDNYASKTKHSMKLSWDRVEGATGYRIEYNGSGDFTKNRVVYYTTNNYYNYTVGGNGMLCIEAKNDEYYRVQPVFGNQDGSWSNTVLAEGYKGSFY